MINRPAFVVIATLILVAAAILASMRARRLLAEHVVQGGKAYERDRQRERSEERWRKAGHALATICLMPLPLLFFVYIDQLTAFGFVTFGAAAAGGLVFAVKTVGGIKPATLLGGDVTVLNEIKLAALGLFVGVLVCVLIAFLMEPALRAALLNAVS